jgi:hypothetical protein
MRKPELKPNFAGGFDLLVEKDAGNPFLILTGKRSLEFFKELRKVCDEAIEKLKSNGKETDEEAEG